MAYDEKQFLDLLQELKSDDTKKARRNASTVAFIVIAAWILEIRLADVKVFGVDLSQTSELALLGFAFVLLFYWTGMFLLSWFHDREIQKEREGLLNSTVSHARERVERAEKDRNERFKQGVPWNAPGDYDDMKQIVDLYDGQARRTERARVYGSSMKKLEIVMPLMLSGTAALVLFVATLQAF